MSCQWVRRNLSEYLDRRLSEADRNAVSAHLKQCGPCAQHSEQTDETRAALQRLPAARPPKWLSTQLQVLASRERIRQQRYGSWAALAHAFGERAQLVMDNLMRPMALPVAGGLVSALFLFSMLVPPLQWVGGPLSDRPIALYTEPTIATASPFGISDEVIVELVLDHEGRIVDYSVPNRRMDRELRAQIGNMILFTSFHPATSFGQPTAGKLTVSFRRSLINIKG